jgi:hypothetical protein
MADNERARMPEPGGFLKVCAPAAILAVFVLSPAFLGGWFGDDAHLANLPWAIESGRLTLVRAISNSIQAWLGNGRFTPLHTVESFLVFDLLRNHAAYEGFIIGLTALAVVTFGVLMARVAGIRIAGFATLWVAAGLQIRAYHDPYIAYNGFVQIVAILTCWSLLLNDDGITGKNRWSTWLALALHLLACLTYEVAYLFAPLYTALALVRLPPARAFARTLPYYAIDAACIALTIFLRAAGSIAAGNPYGYGRDGRAMLGALLNQVSSPLPLSYEITHPYLFFDAVWPPFKTHVSALDVALVLLVAPFAFAAVRERGEAGPPRRPLILFGALLAVLPALPLMLLRKYQIELLPGIGYLPVFLQDLGVGTLAALLLSRRVRMAPAIVAGILAIALVTKANNLRVVDFLAPAYVTSRASFDSVLAQGLLAETPSGGSVAFARSFPWVCLNGACIDDIGISDEIRHFSRRNVRVVDPAARPNTLLEYDESAERWTARRVR